MTPARLRALEVLDQYGSVFVSNVTRMADGQYVPPSIYWQSARWLVDEGYAREAEHGMKLYITSDGHMALVAQREETS